MTVYIEFVIIDNLVINYIILQLVVLSLKLRSKWYKKTLSSLLGTAVAILLPLFVLPQYVIFFVKILLSIAMTVIISGMRPKKFLLSLALFYAYTLLIGGCCAAVVITFFDGTFSGGSTQYSSQIPIGLLALAVAVSSGLAATVVAKIRQRKMIEAVSCMVEIYVGKRRLLVSGIVDTGNLLKDTDTGYSVAVMSYNALKPLITDDDGKINTSELKNLHYIELSTVTTKNDKIMVFRPRKLVLYYADNAHIIEDIMIGITYHDVLKNGCEILMPFVT